MKIRSGLNLAFFALVAAGCVRQTPVGDETVSAAAVQVETYIAARLDQ